MHTWQGRGAGRGHPTLYLKIHFLEAYCLLFHIVSKKKKQFLALLLGIFHTVLLWSSSLIKVKRDVNVIPRISGIESQYVLILKGVPITDMFE